MSQAKVDRYKEEKANRKKILAKEKRKQKNRNIFKCIFNKKYTNICNIINDINGRNNRRFFTI